MQMYGGKFGGRRAKRQQPGLATASLMMPFMMPGMMPNIQGRKKSFRLYALSCAVLLAAASMRSGEFNMTRVLLLHTPLHFLQALSLPSNQNLNSSFHSPGGFPMPHYDNDDEEVKRKQSNFRRPLSRDK